MVCALLYLASFVFVSPPLYVCVAVHVYYYLIVLRPMGVPQILSSVVIPLR